MGAYHAIVHCSRFYLCTDFYASVVHTNTGEYFTHARHSLLAFHSLVHSVIL